MGRLTRRDGSGVHELTAETCIGRAAGSGLRLGQAHVSLQHASVRWTERRTWELRDLQSKNGTYVNGQRVSAGMPVKLQVGTELAFGARTEAFIVTDVSPPRPMLLRVDGAAEPILLRDGLLALPSPEEPTLSLFLDDEGRWCVESIDRVGPLEDGEWLSIGNQHWRCCLPTTPDETRGVGRVLGLFTLAELELSFGVSLDEEVVDVTLRACDREVRLGQKACHYLLLTLARCRQRRDVPAGAVDAEGWVSVGDLLDLLRVSEQRLNVDIFRIRQALRSAGVVDAVEIVERDPQRRRLRLGTDRVVLTWLGSGTPSPSSTR